LNKKQALTSFLLVIIAFAGWLYLTSLAGVLNFAYRTGAVMIKADPLMLAESYLLLAVSFSLALIAIYNALTLVSELKGETIR